MDNKNYVHILFVSLELNLRALSYDCTDEKQIHNSLKNFLRQKQERFLNIFTLILKPQELQN